MMVRTSLFVASAFILVACASYPAPIQHLADAESAARAAQELGGDTSPRAQLHMRLAQEEITRAKSLIDNRDNKRADYVLVRANADAELAIAEVREARTEAEVQGARSAQDGPMQAAAPVVTTTPTTTGSGSLPSTGGGDQ